MRSGLGEPPTMLVSSNSTPQDLSQQVFLLPKKSTRRSGRVYSPLPLPAPPLYLRQLTK